MSSAPWELIRILYRDPEHLCERLTLFACHRLAEPSRDWAQRSRQAHPDPHLREIAQRLGVQSVRVARLEGAVAGTPFYVALVPGYLNYLWQEVRMTLRLAALYGHDPSTLRTGAEVLWLRGVYPNLGSAEAVLRTLDGRLLPPKPATRRSLRTWIQAIDRILIFGGFLSPSSGRPRHQPLTSLRLAVSLVACLALWVITWIFPATLMIAMAWGCDTHARRLFHAAADYYSGEPSP